MTTRRAQPVAAEATDETPKATKTKTPAAPKAVKEKASKVVKEKAPKAPKPEPELDADGNPVKRTRQVRGDRNHLARSIDFVLRAATGPVSIRDIVAGITYADGSHPSSGAVAAAVKRWSEQGYVNVTPKPLAFKSFPAKHAKGNLDAFLTATRDANLAARRAAKAGAAA